MAESLSALLGLLLILFSATTAATADLLPGRARWLWLLPAAVLLLPTLQLIPLPYSIWSQLPGRAALASGLETAGLPQATGAWSVSPMATEGVLWTALVPAGVFMSAVLLSNRGRHVLVLATLAFAALSAFVGLWQLMDGPQSPLYLYRITNVGEAVGLFANRNHLASLLAVTLPLAAGTLSDRLHATGRGVHDLQIWLLTALIVLLSVAVTATRSRAGFILFMLSVVLAAAVLYARRDHGAVAQVRPWLRLGAIVTVVMIVQLTLYGMLNRLDTDPLEEHRWELTANTLKAAAPTQGLGYGLGTFVPAYDEIGDASADIPPYVNHAHNDFAELWLEGGVPAMALTVAALIGLVIGVACAWREPRGDGMLVRPDRGVRIGAAIGLVLLALHSMVDYPLRTLTMATVAALLVAIVVGPVRRHNPRPDGLAISSPIQ